MSKKAQIVVLDLFIALFVFMILVVGVIFTWNTYTTRLEDRLAYNEMMVKAFHVSDLLIKSPGKPTAWEKNLDVEIDTIGLAYNDRNLSRSKIDAFMNLSDAEVKRLLNIRHNFYFKLLYINGSGVTERGQLFSERLGASAVNVKRYVVFENERALLDFTVWE